MTTFNKVLGLVYESAKTTNKLSSKDICQQAGISMNSFIKIKRVLSDMRFIDVIGETKSQKIFWNVQMTDVNPAMVAVTYERYKTLTRDLARVAAEVESSRKKVSIETALYSLAAAGFTGIISKSKTEGCTTVTTSIDLSKID